MIGRIRIGGYKTFADAEARLGGLTVLLGPLGSGRSNFLDLVSLLGRLAQVDRLERAFAPPHRGRSDECLGATPLVVDLELELTPRIPRALNARLAEREKLEGLEASYTRVAERRLRYALSLELAPDSTSVRLADETLEALTAAGEPRRGRRPFFERDPEHGRFIARVEKQGRARYFGSSRRRTLLSEVTDLVYHPHPAAAREELLGIRRFAFEASALRTLSTAPPAEGPGSRGEDFVSFLGRLASEEASTLRRFEEKLAGVGLEHIDLESGSPVPILRMRGDRVPIHLAPTGVLRLIAIAAVLECAAAPSVALFDEPEAGLDASGIAALAQLLRAAAASRRPAAQVIVVTSSEELAARLEPATLIAVRRDPGRGSVFTPIPGEPDDLFRRTALERALQGLECGLESGAPRAARQPARRGRRKA